MQELKNNCIERLKEIRDDFILILNKEKYTIDYIESNYQYYMQIKTSKKLSKYQKHSIEKNMLIIILNLNLKNQHK